MPPIKFEDIPDECIGEIIEALMCEPTISNLKSLSLTNRRLRAISVHYLVRGISLRLPCRISAFCRQIDRLTSLLWRYDAFSSVRCLVAGPWYPQDNDETIKFDLADLNPVYGPADKNVFQNGELEVEANQDCVSNILIELLDRLPGLKDFHCPATLPAALLHALEVKHPKCRLHIYYFDNDSAVNMNLVTSPCLYSIRCIYSDASRAGRPKCNLKSRIMAIIAGMAPSLQEVWMLNERVDEPLFPSEEAENAYWERQGVPFAPHHMFREQAFPSRLGQLKRLHLEGHCRYPIRLDQWANATDFTLLESLEIGINVDGPDLDSLQVHGIFPRLKSMSLRLYDMLARDLETKKRQQLINILHNLPPLQSLKLTGYTWPEIPTQAVQVHGQSLQTLVLFPGSSEDDYESGWLRGCYSRQSLSTKHVLNILYQCPLLEDLRIPVERTYANAHDPAIYKKMGALRRLRSATIYMDCFSVPGEGRTIYEAPELFWTDRYNAAVEEMQDFLRVCALDEDLARDILNTITGERATHVLQKLRIRSSANAKEAGDVYGTEMGTIIHNLAKDYTFTKEADGSMAGYAEWSDDADVSSSCWAMEIFRKNWPLNSSSGNSWKDDWKGIPLEVGRPKLGKRKREE
ncbi:unnamed protein product [Clonostachys byssicola]|uniref:Uncharacterized protein n=1 Tax=Clonostachys byssicola TaxID=160290 RepID=A0A9N9Y3S0_9HYPO|nr:unnamed protein product [Clonostachys byssicola]